ncbi:hypothetical protein [Pleionea sediminis]|uniref:hypothetical protein n=1 Tax=Pleionea sediminis TaxID=2569479 RepID=UPI001184B4A1|nr:hypothetical protein [Pleionea sediminis]
MKFSFRTSLYLICILIISLIVWLAFSPDKQEIHFSEEKHLDVEHQQPRDLRFDIASDSTRITSEDKLNDKSSHYQTIQGEEESSDARVIECQFDIKALREQLSITESDIAWMEKQFYTLESDELDLARLIEYITALEQPEKHSKFETLMNELMLDPKYSPVLSFLLIEHCSTKSEHPFCQPEFLNPALVADDDNGAKQLVNSLYYLRRGETAPARESFREVLNAGYFNEHWGDVIQIFMEAYKQLNIGSHHLRLSGAISQASISGFSTQPLIEFCGSHVDDSAEIKYYCSEIGKVLAKRGQSIATNLSGIILLQELSDKLGNIHDYELYSSKREQIQAYTESDEYINAQNMMMYDESLSEFWYQKLLQYGELEAYRALIAEVRARSKDPDYNPCETEFN